jgi:hypothetical protein
MKTPYQGRARIGDRRADVDIVNVDASRWTGTATNVKGRVVAGSEEVVTLLEQPRPGWSARAVAMEDADGVLQLEGNGQFHAPHRPPMEPGTRSLWVRKSSGPT